LHRKGLDPCIPDGMPSTAERYQGLSPQSPQDFDLFLDPLPTVMKILIERYILHLVPPKANPQSHATATEDVEGRGLFRDERCLPLGEDNDICRQSDLLRYPRHIAEEHKRFQKGRFKRIGSSPAPWAVGVSAEDVVVRIDKREARTFH